MASGPRKQRLTFQQRGPDDNGDLLGDWDKGVNFTRWGRAVVRTKGEAVLQQRLQGLQPVEVTVLSDYSTRQITNAWRMLWKGLPYNIQAVAPGESGAEISILAQGDQSDG